MTELDLEIQKYREDIQRDPADFQAHYNLGYALGRKFAQTEDKCMAAEILAESKEHYELAIRLNEQFFEALTILGIALICESVKSVHDIDTTLFEQAVYYLERAQKIGKEGEEGFLPQLFLAQGYLFKGRASADAGLLLTSKTHHDQLEKSGHSTKNFWEHNAETLVELALIHKDLPLLQSAMDKYGKAVEHGMPLDEVYSRRLVDGYRMMAKCATEPAVMTELIDYMVDIASEALNNDIRFTPTQKQLIHSLSAKIVSYTHELQRNIGKSAPAAIIPFLVLMHHQKELLAEDEPHVSTII